MLKSYKLAVLKLKLPFLTTPPMDDINLLIVLMPIWWFLGVEQFVWLLALPVIFIKMCWIRRGRLIVPEVSRWLMLFLAAYLISGTSLTELSQLGGFLRRFSVFVSSFLLLIIFVNSIHTWKQIQNTIRSLLFFMGTAALIGLLGIVGLWRPAFQAPAVNFMPGFLSRSLIGEFISSRTIGVYANLLNVQYFRVNSIYLYPIMYGTALAVTIPIALFARQSLSDKSKEKLIWTMLAILLVVNLVFTTGRMAWLAFLGGGLFLWFFVRQRRQSLDKLLLFFLVFGVLLFGGSILVMSGALGKDLAEQVNSFIYARSTNQRLLLYAVTLEEYLKKPIFGWGVQIEHPAVNLPLGTHGYYMAILFRHGAIGLLMFALMLWSLWRGTRPIRTVGAVDARVLTINEFLQYGRWSIVAALLDGLTTVHLYDANLTIVLWVLYSLLIASRRIGLQIRFARPDTDVNCTKDFR